MDNTVTPTPAQPVTPVTTHSSSNSHMYVYLVLTAIIAALAVVSGVLLYRSNQPGATSMLPASNNSQATAASLNGTLNINGVIPDGAVFDITATPVGGGTPVKIVSNMQANDNDAWQFNDAEPGASYAVQAILTQNGQEIATSSPVTVTAPANNVMLTMNVTSSDSTQSAVITGNIVVHGYIPTGATITVQGRVLGTGTFANVATRLPGEARQVMTYSTARAGTSYEVQGTLNAADGTTIGTSGVLVVTAPAANETLTINSSATAPAASPAPTAAPNQASPTPAPSASAVISGSVTLNGIAPPNSRIVILQKVYNSSTYAVAVDNITPVTGTTWSWKNPSQSTWYDLVAVLKQRQSDGSDKDISTSSQASVAAPATNVNLTLNSGFSLSPPTGQIGMTCGAQSGDMWNAQITFPNESGAQSYWYQIGTTNGGNQLTSAAVNANGNNPVTITVQFHDDTTYYTSYAYGIQANLAMGNAQYSPFSVAQQMRCN